MPTAFLADRGGKPAFAASGGVAGSQKADLRDRGTDAEGGRPLRRANQSLSSRAALLQQGRAALCEVWGRGLRNMYTYAIRLLRH
jgi:hypothetical protein